jgi:hypothetical protein
MTDDEIVDLLDRPQVACAPWFKPLYCAITGSHARFG